MLDRNTWNHLNIYKLFVLRIVNWSSKGLLVTLNHEIICKLLVLDKNSWNYIILKIIGCPVRRGYNILTVPIAKGQDLPTK